jgi:hypothetical protein
LSTLQASGLSDAHATAISSAQKIGQISARGIAGLSTDFLAQLNTNDIHALSTAQTNALSTSQLESLQVSQTGAFTGDQIHSMQSRLVAAMTANQLQNFSVDQAKALTTADLRALRSLPQMQGSTLAAGGIADLDAAAFHALDASQVAALSLRQLYSLTNDQANALTAEHLAALSSLQRTVLDARRSTNVPGGSQTPLVTAALSDLGIVSQRGTVYTGADTATDGGEIVYEDNTANNFPNVAVYNGQPAPQSQSLVPATSGQLQDGSFAAPSSGSVVSSSTPAPPNPEITTQYSLPHLDSNQIFLPLLPFPNLIATKDPTGDWYRAPSPDDPHYQISYNMSTGEWDYSNPYTGQGVIAGGHGRYHTYREAYASMAYYYGAPTPSVPPDTRYINGTILGPLKVTDSVGSYAYAVDPNNPDFEVGVLVDTPYPEWDIRNIKTGKGVIASGLNPQQVDEPYYSYTYNAGGVSYDDAWHIYSRNFADAPLERAVIKASSYQDENFLAGGTDGTHAFYSNAAPNTLTGATGIVTGLTDADNASITSGAVIGNTGSVSQTLSGLEQGQWYAISFSAVTTALDEVAKTQWDNGTVADGRATGAPQSIAVLLDGNDLGVFSTSELVNDPTGASSWQEFVTAAFQGTTGQHTLTIQGLAPNGATTASLTLSNLQLLQVAPVTDSPLPPGAIDNMTTAEIKGLTPLQVFMCSDTDLQNLNFDQVRALTGDQLSAFWGQNITRFNSGQILEFDPTTQIHALSADQIGALGAPIIQQMNAAQIANIQSLAGLSTTDLATLATSGILSQFSADVTATLKRDQLSSLSPSAVAGLASGAWSKFNAIQLSGLSAFQLAVLPDSSLSEIRTEALSGLPSVSSGLSLKSWLAPPTQPSTLETGPSTAALATMLSIYQQNATGAEPDFSAGLFTASSVAAGTYQIAPSVPGLSFSGAAGIAADRSAINSYQETVTVPDDPGDTSGDAGGAGHGGGSHTITRTVANDSTDGSGFAGFVQGTGSISTTISGLTPNQDYQIAFNSVQGTGSTSEQIAVLVDGRQIGLFSPGAKYGVVETGSFTLTGSGPHSITLQGVDPSNSNGSALVSSLHIALAGESFVLSGGAALQDGAFVRASAGVLKSSTPPSPSPWTFSGNAGIAGPSSAAFVSDGGSVSQTVGGFEDNRTYTIAFEAAQAAGSHEAIQVLVDGNVVDSVVPKDGAYRLEYAATFAPGAGSHTITFRGSGNSGSALFTNVRVLATGFASDGAAIKNGSFENTSSDWSFDSQSGVVGDALANPAENPVTPSGTSAAYLRGSGTFSQEVSDFQTGATYALSFRAAQTPGSSQTFKVLLDGTAVGTFSPGSAYAVYSTSVFSATPGTHRVSFVGLGGQADTALINDVELVLLPGTVMSQDAAADGTSLVAGIPNQDQLQRMQWASLTAAAQYAQANANGGDGLLGVAPNTSGVSGAESPASSLPFHFGWSNGGTTERTVSVSDDNLSLETDISGSDGRRSTLQWSLVGDMPGNQSTVTQTENMSPNAPVSANGTLPTSQPMAAQTTGNPASPTPLPTTTSAPGAATLGRVTSRSDPKPPQSWYQTNGGLGGGKAYAKPPTLPDTLLGQIKDIDPASLPTNDVTTFDALDPRLKKIVAYLYLNDPEFKREWDYMQASRQPLNIQWWNFNGEGYDGVTGTSPDGNGTTMRIDPESHKKGIELTEVIKSRIVHEFSHYDSTWRVFNQISSYFAAFQQEGYTDVQILAGVMDFSVGANGLGFDNTVKDANGHPYIIENNSNKMALDVTSAMGNVSETLAYIGEYLHLLKDPKGANGDPNNVRMQTKLDGSSDPKYAKYLIDWAATQLGLSVKDLELGNISYADVINAMLAKVAGAKHADLKATIDVKNDQLRRLAEALTPSWWAPQERSLTVDAFVQFIEDLRKGGLTNDLKTLADGLKLAGLIQNWNGDPSKINDLLRDSQFVATVSALIEAFKAKSPRADFAAASAVASEVASRLKGNAIAGTASGAAYVSAVASVLNDVALMFSGGSGPGSLVKDLSEVQALYGTVQALLPLAHIPLTEAERQVLTEVGYGIGDVIAIVQGFQLGGALGGLEAGYAADALVHILASLPRLGLSGLGPYALPIGIAIGLAAAFFGGSHDKPENMPDKYDTENYGQGVANLQGSAGASGHSFTENSSLVNLFGGRTGIQAVEETLAQYTAATAPAWLRPLYADLESKFGSSDTGSGQLSVGIGGTGKDCNNQQIVNVSGVSGQEYQYTQLDASLNQFQAAYAKARAAGEAVAMSWKSDATPGAPPPSDSYTSTSYLASDNWYA